MKVFWKLRWGLRKISSTLPSEIDVIISDLPNWGEIVQEYTNEELGPGAALKNPPSNVTLYQGSKKTEIGRWGEYLVYNYLLQQQEMHGDISSINWCNSDDETGNPYDFEVKLNTEQGEVSIYVEVKSTLSDTKDWFEISFQQVKFALQKKEQFHVYRVFSAGDMEKVRLVHFDNLSQRLHQKQVKLCMLI